MVYAIRKISGEDYAENVFAYCNSLQEAEDAIVLCRKFEEELRLLKEFQKKAIGEFIKKYPKFTIELGGKVYNSEEYRKVPVMYKHKLTDAYYNYLEKRDTEADVYIMKWRSQIADNIDVSISNEAIEYFQNNWLVENSIYDYYELNFFDPNVSVVVQQEQ